MACLKVLTLVLPLTLILPACDQDIGGAPGRDEQQEGGQGGGSGGGQGAAPVEEAD